MNSCSADSKDSRSVELVTRQISVDTSSASADAAILPDYPPSLGKENARGNSLDHPSSTRRLFSLPEPPAGLATPAASPTQIARSLSLRSVEQQAILSGGPVTQIHNCRVVRDHAIEFDDVWFQDGRVINPTSLYGLRNPDIRINARGLIVAPGLVDVQLNGAFGHDFSFDRDNIAQCMDAVSHGILLQGCTSFCPTVVSSMCDTYRKVLPHLGRRLGSLKNGAESLGAHVEGPFMNPRKKGAHELACLRTAPNGLADFDECYGLDNLRDYVAYMTAAPEVNGVLETIPSLVDSCKIGVSLGHSAATHDVARQAHRNGAKMITHLFNAMTCFHHRDPGIVGLLGAAEKEHCFNVDTGSLTTDTYTPQVARSFYGLICDGIHVHPNTVKIAYNSHPAGAILVTDAMGAMGLPDGEYKLGNMSVDVGLQKGMAGCPRAAVIQGTHTLAGSIVTLIECVRNFMEYTQCPLVEALEAASLHPAQMLGIADRKGTLKYGADADIIILTDSLQVESVFVRGELATPETVGR